MFISRKWEKNVFFKKCWTQEIYKSEKWNGGYQSDIFRYKDLFTSFVKVFLRKSQCFCVFQKLVKDYEVCIQQKKQVSSENKTLKREIDKLVVERDPKSSSENFKQYQDDINGLQSLGNNLKYEINRLAKQNVFLRNRWVLRGASHKTTRILIWEEELNYLNS